VAPGEVEPDDVAAAGAPAGVKSQESTKPAKNRWFVRKRQKPRLLVAFSAF
jgi:hypothetical protein